MSITMCPHATIQAAHTPPLLPHLMTEEIQTISATLEQDVGNVNVKETVPKVKILTTKAKYFLTVTLLIIVALAVALPSGLILGMSVSGGVKGDTGGGKGGANLRISFLDVATKRNNKRSLYGNDNTRGKVLSTADVSSFKIAPLQVVMCRSLPTSNEFSPRNRLMGFGGQGVSDILDAFSKYNCSLVCGYSVEELRSQAHKYSCVRRGSSDVMNSPTAQADIDAYSASLSWVDLKGRELHIFTTYFAFADAT